MKRLLLLLLIPLAAYGQEGVTVTNKANFPVQTKIVNADPIPVVMAPAGSDKQVLFNNMGVVAGAENLTYDLTQLPGLGSTNVVTIGPPESTLDSFVRGFASPEHTLFTSKKAAGVGYDTTVVIETSTDSDYAAGLIIATMISPATAGSAYALQTTPIIGGSGTVNRCIGYEVNPPSKTGTPTLQNSIGIQIDPQNPNNLATNSWGLVIADQGAGNYAIQVGGGKVDLGPQATTVGSLVVNGDGSNVPVIRVAQRVTAQSAANASIATFTVGASDGSFEVSMNMNVTAATAISTSMNCTYKDESNTSRTMIFPVTSLTGSFLAGGLVVATGAFETPVMHIRCKAATSITLFTATGTFTGVTYTAEGIIKQTQ